MRGQFFCKGCGGPITGVIEVESLKDPSVKRPSLKLQQPVAPCGSGYKSRYKSYDPGGWSKQKATDPEPTYWLNPDDVKPYSKYIKGRCIGCCGIAGLDGPNHQCAKCGAEIGTEESDCYTPYIFITESRNIEFEREDR
ncbi:hypothetical protein [uncultured Erythrobacter sp.]|uniref:hypothetical protein n=1 Tax=uncultured Erythrobacter sp. TaxID=263913 RepID=UPI00260573BC|nr:hypothetical protein [uncultured Erythrobacter sp.]